MTFADLTLVEHAHSPISAPTYVGRDKAGSGHADAVVTFKVFPCKSRRTKLPDLHLVLLRKHQKGACRAGQVI